MKILASPFSHETTLHNFGIFEHHDFYIPTSEADNYETAKKDYKHFYPNENIPDNLHYDERPSDYDIALGQDINMMFHYKNSEFVKKSLNVYQSETQLVTNPPENDNWILIKHGIDTDRFKEWEGGGPMVTLCNDIYNRSAISEKTKKYANKLKEEYGDRYKIYGNNNPDGFTPHNKTPEILRKANFYLRIRTAGFSPFNIGEAMCTGCPIISLPHPTITDDIIQNYNGIITRNISKIIKRLSSDNKWKETLSKNARRFGKNRFNLEKNLARWDFAFKRAKIIKEGRK